MHKTWEAYLPDEKLWIFNLELTNPTQLTAYDLRVVFIPNPYSGDYIANPDDFTHRWNSMCAEWVNGFKAYCQLEDKRAFLPGHSDTQQFWIYENTPFGQVLEFELVIEVSYPGNCDGPYEISGQYCATPVPYYGSGTVFVNVLNHQGGTEHVWIDTTPITGGLTQMEHCGGPLWVATVPNIKYPAWGTYSCKITADNYYGSEQYYLEEQLYDFVDIPVMS